MERGLRVAVGLDGPGPLQSEPNKASTAPRDLLGVGPLALFG